MIESYKISGDTTELYIPHKDTLVTVFISTEDLERVLTHPYSWVVGNFQGTGSGFRTYSAVRVGPKKQKTLYLHRFIMQPSGDLQVDHIDNDTLNNRRSNLRLATSQENNQNKKGACRKNNTGMRGVSYHSRDDVWQANIRINGKLLHLGYHNSPEAAERAAKAARAEHFPFSKEGMVASLQEAA